MKARRTGLGRTLRALAQLPHQAEGWLQSLVRLPGSWSGPVRPADVSRRLVAAMLARENVLEDAHYTKVVPNAFWVQIDPATYERYYRPIEHSLQEQWQRDLLDSLIATNQRQGRREFQLRGPVTVHLEASPAARPGEVHIRCQVIVAPEAEIEERAGLELLPGGRQWVLREGLTTIGRDEGCDICLDLARFQEKPLVSGQHAYVRGANGRYRLFDGTPDGRASRNGTYVNGQPVSGEGTPLKEGDVIVLAALSPAQPRADLPGAAAFLFVKPDPHESEP